jgi:hypothetical protein
MIDPFKHIAPGNEIYELIATEVKLNYSLIVYIVSILAIYPETDL